MYRKQKRGQETATCPLLIVKVIPVQIIVFLSKKKKKKVKILKLIPRIQIS